MTAAGSEPMYFSGTKQGSPIVQFSEEHAVARRLKVDVTVHGFRLALRDWAGEGTTFPREVTEAALAHVVGMNGSEPFDLVTSSKSAASEWMHGRHFVRKQGETG